MSPDFSSFEPEALADYSDGGSGDRLSPQAQVACRTVVRVSPSSAAAMLEQGLCALRIMGRQVEFETTSVIKMIENALSQ